MRRWWVNKQYVEEKGKAKRAVSSFGSPSGPSGFSKRNFTTFRETDSDIRSLRPEGRMDEFRLPSTFKFGSSSYRFKLYYVSSSSSLFALVLARQNSYGPDTSLIHTQTLSYKLLFPYAPSQKRCNALILICLRHRSTDTSILDLVVQCFIGVAGHILGCMFCPNVLIRVF